MGKKNDVKSLAEALVEVEKKQRSLMKRSQEVFDAFIAMNEEKEHLTEELKAAARKEAILGETRTIVDNNDVSVSVHGSVKQSFDLERARKEWSQEVLNAVCVTTVDKGLVDALIKSGKFAEEQANKARVLKADTARVIIKLK